MKDDQSAPRTPIFDGLVARFGLNPLAELDAAREQQAAAKRAAADRVLAALFADLDALEAGAS